MRNLRALIVDDEYPARQELRFLLEQYDCFEVIGEASHGCEALKLISALDYSLIFLDVEMPGMTGLELSQILQQKSTPPLIVFITAFEQYALKAFDVNAIDYLLKPFDETRLKQTMEKVFRLMNKPAKRVLPKTKIRSRNEKIPVVSNNNGKTLLLSREDLVYVYTKDNAVYVKTPYHSYRSLLSLKDLEERLDSDLFFRTHRCYLVNLTKVQEIIPYFNGTYTMIVNDDQKSEIPVTRSQAQKLRKLLGM